MMTKRAMKMPSFVPRPGSNLNTKDAQVVGERLYILFGGRMDRVLASPQRIVDDASAKTSPLHPYFEWDDTKAADAYRLDRARQLARSVEITVTRTEPSPKQAIRTEQIYFGNIRDHAASAVRVEKEDLSSVLLTRAATELKAWLVRYRPFVASSAFKKAVASVEAAYRDLIQ